MNRVFDWEQTPQFSPVQLLLATFIPSAIAFVGFRVVLPMMVDNGMPVITSWATIASVMLFGFVIVAIYLLRSEAKQMDISFWTRIALRGLSRRDWGIYLAMMLVATVLVMFSTPLTVWFMNALSWTPPDYMPFFLNPQIDPMNTDPSILSPNLQLQGNFALIPLMAVTLILNILTEELYFRAWMLPKLAKYGNWGWIANGVLFALYHTMQLWLLPTLLVASLAMAFIFYRSKSIWPVFIGHFVGNFLLTIMGMLALIAA